MKNLKTVFVSILLFVITGYYQNQLLSQTDSVLTKQPSNGQKLQIEFKKIKDFVFGQDSSHNHSAKVPKVECTEKLRSSTVLKQKHIEMFANTGINIVKYDWKNAEMNCHVNLAAKHYASKKNSNALAWLCLSLGATAILMGAGLDPPAALVVPGSFVFLGSVPFFILKVTHKKKMMKHVNEVAKFYRENGLL